MYTPKSLKRLRSASTSYLEDSGSMLHSVDSLIRDVQHSLQLLAQREASVADREAEATRRELLVERRYAELVEQEKQISRILAQLIHQTSIATVAPTGATKQTESITSSSAFEAEAASVAEIEAELIDSVSSLESTLKAVVAEHEPSRVSKQNEFVSQRPQLSARNLTRRKRRR